MSGRKKGLGRGLSALMNDAALNAPDVPVEPPLETKSVQAGPDGRDERKSLLGSNGEEGRLIEQLVDTRRTDEAPSQEPRTLNVAVSRLQRNPDQPRKIFERNALDDLIASIQQKGVLQPILVRALNPSRPTTNFQIVAGERRWQAAIKAGLTSVPIMVRDLSDRDVLEIGVVENVQRADLNPMEEALAYERLINEFGRTQAEIATTIGKSRVHVANTVRLTGLSRRARDLLLKGRITAGHARAVLAAEDPNALVEAILASDMSVREAENWVKRERAPRSAPRRKAVKTPDISALEQSIQDRTGLAADIRHGQRGGEIRLKYKDLDQMQALLNQLGIDPT